MAVSADVLLKIMAQTGGSEEAIKRVQKQLEDLGHTSEKTGKQTKTLGEESKKAGENIEDFGSKSKKTQKETEGFYGVLNQLRIGFEQLSRGEIGGIPNIIKAAQGYEKLTEAQKAAVLSAAAVGGALLGVAAAAVTAALAIGGVALAAAGMISTAERIGTRSKEDFEELNKTFKSLGLQITEIDRALSQELLRSVDQVKAATDNLFLQLIRTTGPELVFLLREITELFKQMGPFVIEFGRLLSDVFIVSTAYIKTFGLILQGLRKDWISTLGVLSDPRALEMLFEASLESIIRARAEFKPGKPTFDKKKAKKQREKDITDAELDARRLERLAQDAARVRQEEIDQIDAQAEAGTISLAEYRAELIRIEQRYMDKQRAALDQRIAQITREEKFENKRKDAIEKAVFATASAFEAAQRNIAATEAKEQAQADKRFARIREEELERRRLISAMEDQMVMEETLRVRREEADRRAREAREGAPPVVRPEDIGPPLRGLDEFAANAENVLSQVGQSFGTVEQIITGGLVRIADALAESISGWILYGKFSGKALKQAAAEAIAGMAAQSLVAAVFHTAAGLAALAWGNAVSAGKHFAAAKEFATVGVIAAIAGAAVGAGGGLAGGTEAGAAQAGGFGGTPGPVTINQGGAAGFLGVRPDIVLAADLMSRQTEALERFTDKFLTASPGHVLIAGAAERPEAVTDATLEMSRRSSGFTRELLSNAGVS
jgi:Lambda phage tail tape-measure protein (Tape_meas_lam_C)